MSDSSPDNTPLTSAEIDARATRAHLDEWLARATRGLSDTATKRLREEAETYVYNRINREGINGTLAVEQLGSPKKENRRYRRMKLPDPILTDDWLAVATEKLTVFAEKRVREEIRGHIATFMVRDGIDESAAVAMLGSPSKANRRYKRRYLNEGDQKQLKLYSNPPTWFRVAHLVACILLALMLPIGILESKPILASMLYVAASGAFASSLVYFQWMQSRVEKLRAISSNLDSKTTKRELWRFALFGLAPHSVGMLLMLSGQLHMKQIPASTNADMLIPAGFLAIAGIRAYTARKIFRNKHDALAIIKRAWEEDPCD